MTSGNSIVKQIYECEASSGAASETLGGVSDASARAQTVASQFRAGLKKLMHILYAKEPAYVRCIKPNHQKRAGTFDAELVRHQVKYLSLLENLRVRRAGFAYKKPYGLFLSKYKCLCALTWPRCRAEAGAASDSSSTAREGVSRLLTHLGYTLDVEYSLGVSKLFVRSSRTFFALEDRLDARKHELASRIKALYKGYRQRRDYQRTVRAALTLVMAARRWLLRRRLDKRRAARASLARFMSAYLKRNEEYGDRNKLFLKRVYAKFLIDLRGKLPTHFAEDAWPACPRPCQKTSDLLKSLSKRNLVRKFCLKFSPELTELVILLNISLIFFQL